MPYIKKADRAKFVTPIQLALGVLNESSDNAYLKGEFFGYLVNRLSRRFLGTPDYQSTAFNSTLFNDSKKKTLDNAADSIANLLTRGDPMTCAGELNYSISAIYWGFLGDCEQFAQAGYGMRAYLNGILDKIVNNIETVNSGSQKDATMAFRRHLIIRGVLDHVKHETYARKTTPYEETKIEENGQVWFLGKLVIADEVI